MTQTSVISFCLCMNIPSLTIILRQERPYVFTQLLLELSLSGRQQDLPVLSKL